VLVFDLWVALHNALHQLLYEFVYNFIKHTLACAVRWLLCKGCPSLKVTTCFFTPVLPCGLRRRPSAAACYISEKTAGASATRRYILV
jgi:hypothetical protein